MNKSFTILIALAIILGIGSLFLIKKIVESEKARVRAEMPRTEIKEEDRRDVLVAKEDLETGIALTELNVGVVKVPVSIVPETALSSMDQIKERFAMQNIYKGQFILDPMARTREQLPRPSMMIEPGKRLISVRVDEVKASGFLIKNGDYVDIMGSFPVTPDNLPKGGYTPLFGQMTVRFLQRVKVFDIIHGGAAAESGGEGQGRLAMGTNATFEVSPQEADVIANAETVANSLWLVLRRFDDDKIIPPQNSTEELIIANLQRIQAEAPPPPEPTRPAERRRTVF